VSIMISNKLSKEAKREGINLRLVAEAAIKRAMEKREFLSWHKKQII
jgi:post-segregation antitoxin (ccd killing protein)